MSIGDLKGSGAELIVGIEPSAVIMQKIPESVVRHGLGQKLVEAATPAMLAEVERAYATRERFAFVAWSPH